MKLRAKKALQPETAPVLATSAPKLKVVRTKTAPAAAVEHPKKRGGVRPGAGRPPVLRDGDQKEKSAYVSMTEDEKQNFKRLAAKDGLTLSFYLRRLLGLPIPEEKKKTSKKK